MIDRPLLANKVAIITGAGRGIGAAAARLFARAGAAVVLAARTEADIRVVAERIKADGGTALAIPTDVTDVAQVDLLITLTLRAFPNIDILVNNAAVIEPIGKTWQTDPRQWRRLIDINVVGPYLCARAVLPQMLDRGDGRIINVSSGAARTPVEGWSAYCTSKAALDQFTAVLAEEIRTSRIVACSVNPGPTDTPMQADIRRASTVAFPRVEAFRQYHESGQLFTPEEAAQLLLWLASDFGHAQNGAILGLSNETLRQTIAADLAMPLIMDRRA